MECPTNVCEMITDKIKVQSTFLGETEWLTIPWGKHPETRMSPAQSLLDITAMGSYLFSKGILELAKMSVTGGNYLEVIEEYIPKLIEAIKRSVRWRWQWEEANPNCCRELAVDPERTIMKDSQGRLLFESVLWYRSFDLCCENIFFNCVLEWLMWYSAQMQRPTLVEEVIQSMPEAHGRVYTNPLGYPRPGVPMTHACPEILRSMEYILHEHKDRLGTFVIWAPMRTT
jgi:hypothetical protein